MRVVDVVFCAVFIGCVWIRGVSCPLESRTRLQGWWVGGVGLERRSGSRNLPGNFRSKGDRLGGYWWNVGRESSIANVVRPCDEMVF